MAQTKTYISQALTANANLMIVAAATGAVVGDYVKIEDELAKVASIDGLNIGLKFRGCEGTLAVAHNNKAPVVFCAADDLPALGPQTLPGDAPPRDIRTYSAAGAIALPNGRDMIAIIGVGEGSSLHAYTLADPPKNTSGYAITIVSASAYAHTVTLTTGFGGTNATDVFTMSGAVGDAITLVALHGTWQPIATALTAAEGASAAVA